MSRSLAAVMSPSARKEPGARREVGEPRSLIAAALARHEVGSLALAADGRILEVAGAVERWLGAAASEIVGTWAWEWTTTLTASTWRVHWLSLRDARPTIVAMRLKARDGTLRAVEGRLMFHEVAGQAFCVVLFEPDRRGCADTRGERDLRLEFMLTEGTDGIWDYNIPAGTMFCSPAYLAMLGLSEPPRDIPAALGLVHPDDQERSEAERAAVFRGEKDSVEQELRLQHSDGHWRWVVLRVRVLSRDAQGMPVRLMGSVVDVTARKEAELALRRDRDLFEALMQTSPTPMLVVGDDSRIIFVNAALRRLVGLVERPLAQWGERASWPLFTLDGAPARPEALPSRLALAQRAPVYDVRLFLGQGRGRKLLSCNAVPIFEESGGLACAVVAVSDITAQVEAERALHQSARDLRETLEQLPIGVAVVAANGAITLCNPALARMAQTTMQRLIGADILRTDWRLADESGQLIRFPVHSIYRPWITGETVRGMVLQGPMDADETRWVVVDLVPRRDDRGALRDVVLSMTDVTYRRRVEASLMQAQKVESLGRLATGIAHDFNNLLTAVLGGADLVAEMLPPELPV
ncbi:MAG: PAS domain S-box protein, partial [bacterium]